MLDLELGYDETEGVGEGPERALKFISRGDPAYCVSPEASARSVEELKKAEMFQLGKMLVAVYFSSSTRRSYGARRTEDGNTMRTSHEFMATSRNASPAKYNAHSLD